MGRAQAVAPRFPGREGARFPALTLGLSCLAIAATLSPRLSELLIYDRGLILSGEPWRIATAPFVHLSASHLFFDLLVFCLAGILLETADRRGFLLLGILSILLPGLFFLAFCPGLLRYGGLSGPAVGAAALLCLQRAGEPGRARWAWAAVLAVIVVKTAVESATGAAFFARSGNEPFRVLSSAHAIGMSAALAVFLMRRPDRPRPPRTSPAP